MSKVSVYFVTGYVSQIYVDDIIERLLSATRGRLFLLDIERDIIGDTTPIIMDTSIVFSGFFSWLTLLRKRDVDLYIVLAKSQGLRFDRRLIQQVDKVVECHYDQYGHRSTDTRHSVRALLEG